MTDKEIFRLQGLDPNRFQVPPGMRASKVRHAVGNAMSGNVIRMLLEASLTAMGCDIRQPPRR